MIRKRPKVTPSWLAAKLISTKILTRWCNHELKKRAGTHAIDAFFTGRGPHERDYKRGTTLKFDKGTEPRYIELRIKDSLAKLQPEFEVKVWQ